MVQRCLALLILLGLLALIVPLTAGAQVVVTVSAAASLAEAFREVGVRFEAKHSGTAARFNVAASGVLLQQIAHGAPVDVLATADAETMDRGIEHRLIDGSSRRDFASNGLVLVVPATGGPAIAGLADLAGPSVKRVALGKPAIVPAGRYARQALDAQGRWPAVEPKVVYADSVRQALDYVARGEADAGVVYRTDAAQAPAKVKVAATLGGHAPVRYPVAWTTEAARKPAARAFVAFLLSPDAQAILARHGFGSLP